MIKGFTALESVLVLSMICIVMVISIPVLQCDVSLFAFDDLFRSELVCLEQEAYLNNENYQIEISYDGIQMKHELFCDIEGTEFRVTKLGRVSKPVTLIARGRSAFKKIKVWLGMGRVHVEG